MPTGNPQSPGTKVTVPATPQLTLKTSSCLSPAARLRAAGQAGVEAKIRADLGRRAGARAHGWRT
eukprot:scaffold24329_cov101-Isochrysis_galbana.AAC.4